MRHDGVHICQDCGDECRHFKGYRKHIIFDLLKEKADLFYKKMLDRKLMEEQFDREIKCANDYDELSQDSENYNDEYMQQVQNQPKEAAPEQEEQLSFEDAKQDSANGDACQLAEAEGEDPVDDLAQEIRDSLNINQKASEAAEVESAYSELVEEEPIRD